MLARLLSLLALTMMVSTASASSILLPTPPLQEGGPARPLHAATALCDRHPGECVVDRTEPARIQLTPKVWRQLNAVNRRVNRTLSPVKDQDHWGVIDRWDFAEDGKGDCEDYQLLKRRRLAALGLPRRAMRMTVVIDDIGEGHAVLMVRTDIGDLILDNKTQTILPWTLTGYAFIKREGDEERAWVKLDPERSQQASAAH